MRRYVLTCSHNGQVDVQSFEAENDTEATVEAIRRVMRDAFTSTFWAEGLIVLSQGDRVVHTMEAKA